MVDALIERMLGVRREGQVRHTTVLYVLDLRADGYRKLLGTWIGAPEK